jgi:serine/threonine protein kinase
VNAGDDLGERLAAEMDAAWSRGERLPAEHFLGCHPELLERSEEAVRLVYEEICLRQQRGEEVTAEELARRFPGWANELAVMLDCHRLIHAHLTPPEFPAVGDSLGDFRLIAELGRGTRARVFLATQPTLADRPVVLKVTPRQDREFLSLARLQHTHIIPLHGVHDFPARNLRALCQPYLGGTTLARLLDLLHDVPAARRTGRALVDALDQAEAANPLPLPAPGGPRAALAKATYTEAVCWIGACLAEGLQHAHQRGLVHLDLKPSNVLLATDGQPLLLDFHLALHPVAVGQVALEGMGGTLEYMSPEQHAAYAAARCGQPVELAIDRRSDVYSLGKLLYVALGGKENEAADLSPLHSGNAEVSVGLSDIVHRCLRPYPADRYPDASALAADLRRHLAALPLRGVPNRSLLERVRKWRRRQPYALLWIAALLLLAAVPAALGTAAWMPWSQRPEPGAGLRQRPEEMPIDQDFWTHFYRGVRAYRRGQPADAVHAFDVAVARAPEYPQVYHNRALAHSACGNLGAALSDYDRALALAPTLAPAALNRGILHYERGDYQQALADLKQALRHGADPAVVYTNLALVQLARGETAAARQSVTQALHHNPMHAPARHLHDRLWREK